MLFCGANTGGRSREAPSEFGVEVWSRGDDVGEDCKGDRRGRVYEVVAKVGGGFDRSARDDVGVEEIGGRHAR